MAGGRAVGWLQVVIGGLQRKQQQQHMRFNTIHNTRIKPQHTPSHTYRTGTAPPVVFL
jgi:hypothetical protein